MKSKALVQSALSIAIVFAGLHVEAQSVGRIRKSLDKATGGSSASPAQPAPAAPQVDPQAAAKAQAQAAATKALYDKRNKAAQVGADQRVIEFLKQRIEGGSADAAYDLGKRYTEGKGVPVDPVEARRLYRLSAERGSEDAQKWLDEHPEPKAAERTKESGEKADSEKTTQSPQQPEQPPVPKASDGNSAKR